MQRFVFVFPNRIWKKYPSIRSNLTVTTIYEKYSIVQSMEISVVGSTERLTIQRRGTAKRQSKRICSTFAKQIWSFKLWWKDPVEENWAIVKKNGRDGQREDDIWYYREQRVAIPTRKRTTTRLNRKRTQKKHREVKLSFLHATRSGSGQDLWKTKRERPLQTWKWSNRNPIRKKEVIKSHQQLSLWSI